MPGMKEMGCSRSCQGSPDKPSRVLGQNTRDLPDCSVNPTSTVFEGAHARAINWRKACSAF